MIRTIGALVKEPSNRTCWLVATSFYILACLGTSALLGMLLSLTGIFIRQSISDISLLRALPPVNYIFVGIIAIAYALSDVGLLRLPRPSLMRAVPVVWWRHWRPYGAALAYGAALGLGVTTYIHFGAFYILCLWCIVQGNPLYGAALMGAYGLARAFVLFPGSWYVYRYCPTSEGSLVGLLANLQHAKLVVATMLILFGVYLITSGLY